MEGMMSGLLPEALLIDHSELDSQHEEIFVRIESLKAFCFENGYLPFDRFEALLACFGEHFATEERIAQEAGLEFSLHTRTHRANLRVMHRALDEVREGVRDVHSFLRYVEFWFERHIIQDDKPFAASLRARARHRAAGPQPRQYQPSAAL